MSEGFDPMYFAMRAVFGPPLTMAFGVKTEGRHHLPRKGAAILAANHASFLDPIVIGLRARRPVRFLVSREFYADRRLHALLRWFGTIPVGGPAGMVRSFRHSAEVIRNGGVLGIFPEGGITRDGALRPFRAGAATLALRLGVPIVPIHVGGTFEALPRTARWPRFVPVTLRIGEPIPIEARPDASTEAIAALTATVRRAITALAANGR